MMVGDGIRDAALEQLLRAGNLNDDQLTATIDAALREHWALEQYPGSRSVGVRSHVVIRRTLEEVLQLYLSPELAKTMCKTLRRTRNDDSFYDHGSWGNRTELRASLATFYPDLSNNIALAAPLESDAANYWCKEALNIARALCDEQKLDLVRIAKPDNDSFYRARCARSGNFLVEVTQDPAKHLGPAPLGSAAASRLSTPSRSCFYGATSADTCLSELRLESGWLVAVGQFTPTRLMTLLDLTVLPRLEYRLSIFEKDYRVKTEWIGLLRGLTQEISEPAWPDDHARTYRTTQYFAAYAMSRAGWDLDGIIYPSSQNPSAGKNVAIFGGPELTTGRDPLLRLVDEPSWREVTAVRVDTRSVHVAKPAGKADA